MVLNPTYLAQRTRSCMFIPTPRYPRAGNIAPQGPLFCCIIPLTKREIAVNWQDARRRVLKSYREWLRASPEIQGMYSLSLPVSAIRTKIRQEFERHRYVNQLPVVDVLLFQSHSEYQVRLEVFLLLSYLNGMFSRDTGVDSDYDTPEIG
ncbi:uncharacterized protein PADG_06279 [Paracoccidioides brasiliensis Pb18]|uniref:Uncharacterized protein n=1 Tax=Paracoccidioides brasiliensis (strain Pb18) TaxID=502780 RepID=C1GG42_PARBD|nr:uncharacterized protein PADG_06279 [Paracoccidioides brasiliensis Pb18]EEH50200.2 hypothetical protein PADG_06279 [Paracoccidioides brasiliensis Pb18]